MSWTHKQPNKPPEGANIAPQALALGSYRHDIAYTGALKSSFCQALALGTYRNDIAYTGALKSSLCQVLALGTYRNDIAYTGALKSVQYHDIGNHHTGLREIKILGWLEGAIS